MCIQLVNKQNNLQLQCWCIVLSILNIVVEHLLILIPLLSNSLASVFLLLFWKAHFLWLHMLLSYCQNTFSHLFCSVWHVQMQRFTYSFGGKEVYLSCGHTKKKSMNKYSLYKSIKKKSSTHLKRKWKGDFIFSSLSLSLRQCCIVNAIF